MFLKCFDIDVRGIEKVLQAKNVRNKMKLKAVSGYRMNCTVRSNVDIYIKN